MIIGVTGRSGAGKSTFCRKTAKELNFIYVDIDSYCHTAIQENKVIVLNIIKEIDDKAFSHIPHFVSYKEKYIRQEIGNLIFSNQEKYKRVVEIVWKFASIEIDTVLEKNKYVILDHILLPYTHYWKQCDRKILISANNNERYSRILNRDSISLEYLYKRESASPSYENITFDSVIET